MTKPAQINFSNVIAYIIGNIRYKLYYSRYKFLIPTHILEQIDFRIKYMKKECYENGQCVICGCTTTALQMANKSCDLPCYPPMMSKSRWVSFKEGYLYIPAGNYGWQLKKDVLKRVYYTGQFYDETITYIKSNNNV